MTPRAVQKDGCHSELTGSSFDVPHQLLEQSPMRLPSGFILLSNLKSRFWPFLMQRFVIPFQERTADTADTADISGVLGGGPVGSLGQ